MEKKNKIYSMIFSIIATAITGCITIFIISKTIDKDSNAIKNIPADTAVNVNVTDTVLNKQIDSIKSLNETILEIRKELDELKRQKTTARPNR